MLQVNSTGLNMEASCKRLSCANLASFDYLEFKLKLLPYTQAFPLYSLQYKETSRLQKLDEAWAITTSTGASKLVLNFSSI